MYCMRCGYKKASTSMCPCCGFDQWETELVAPGAFVYCLTCGSRWIYAGRVCPKCRGVRWIGPTKSPPTKQCNKCSVELPLLARYCRSCGAFIPADESRELPDLPQLAYLNFSIFRAKNLADFETMVRDISLNFGHWGYALLFRGQTAEYPETGTNKPLLIPRMFREPKLGDQRAVDGGLTTPPYPLYEGPISSYLETLISERLKAEGVDLNPQKVLLNLGIYGQYTHARSGYDPFESEPVAPFSFDHPLGIMRHFGNMWHLTGGKYKEYFLTAIAQHYGASTESLDVTFAPEVALWFATHKLTKASRGSMQYTPWSQEGVVYVLRLAPMHIWELPGKKRVVGHLSKKPSEWAIEHVAEEVDVPAYVDLQDVFLDSSTRPRRQQAAFLTELIHFGRLLPPNHYSGYIVAKIVIVPHDSFHQHGGTLRCQDSKERLFPVPDQDKLLAHLLASGFEWVC